MKITLGSESATLDLKAGVKAQGALLDHFAKFPNITTTRRLPGLPSAARSSRAPSSAFSTKN